jgi:hypothetical protein
MTRTHATAPAGGGPALKAAPCTASATTLKEAIP